MNIVLEEVIFKLKDTISHPSKQISSQRSSQPILDGQLIAFTLALVLSVGPSGNVQQ